MKLVKILFLLSAVAAISLAQQAPQVVTQTIGINAPDQGRCNDTSLNTTYMQTEDPANGFNGMFICAQAGPRTFGWAAVVMLPPGTTGTKATTLVYPSFCGSTVGNQACANMSNGTTVRTIAGIATLASNSAVISGISPAFTGTATFSCTASNETTRADVVSIARTSSSSITITDTGGASDVIAWQCTGY